IVVFFFQAEDGIRDRSVTGVQTCALPISVEAGGGDSTPVWLTVHYAQNRPKMRLLTDAIVFVSGGVTNMSKLAKKKGRHLSPTRSEERRVGKECRRWWWASW